MRPGPLNTCLACLYFLICSSALPRNKEYTKTSGSDFGPSDVGKASRNGLGITSKEPSCDELRVMWRISKRQSRAAEITNEIPTYRDPFAYNVWDSYEYPRARSAGRGSRYRRPMVYGRVIHNVPRQMTGEVVAPDNSPDRIRAFEEVARLFGKSPDFSVSRIPSQRKTSFRTLGGGASPLPHHHIRMQEPLSGSFQHLKELIIAERARELQEQRMTEEAAARAEALKDVVGNIHFGRIVQDQKVHAGPYDQTGGGDSGSSSSIGRSRGIVAFPDLLAPASSHYLEDDLLPSPQMASYKQRSYDGDSVGELDSNPWTTW
ncbi:uncharacterized protein LOC142322819 [Lycorma delicatula]|uniref:uncharacterized protein LOC142322819 n=1 Tax=Lycorma delicatula TaxID=130591 RepID=UPI003F513BD0